CSTILHTPLTTSLFLGLNQLDYTLNVFAKKFQNIIWKHINNFNLNGPAKMESEFTFSSIFISKFRSFIMNCARNDLFSLQTGENELITIVLSNKIIHMFDGGGVTVQMNDDTFLQDNIIHNIIIIIFSLVERALLRLCSISIKKEELYIAR
ncbi:hypothetical protein ACJX0J_029895, partial [Zea mays]